MTRAYVILVNWNGWRDTLECLESLFRTSEVEPRVIVCDNASTDGSLEHIRNWAEGIQAAPAVHLGPLQDLAGSLVEKPLPYVEYDRDQAEAGGDPQDSDCPLILVQCGNNLGFAGGNNVGLRYLLARGRGVSGPCWPES